jgi:hypothetical protein
MGPTTGKRRYLQVNFAEDDHQIQLFKAVDLAELLFNLQHVTNFNYCVDRLRHGDIGSALAELDIARMLYINCIKFWFVAPVGQTGWDYDLEVVYPSGIIACLEVKCNLEAQGHQRQFCEERPCESKEAITISSWNNIYKASTTSHVRRRYC